MTLDSRLSTLDSLPDATTPPRTPGAQVRRRLAGRLRRRPPCRRDHSEPPRGTHGGSRLRDGGSYRCLAGGCPAGRRRRRAHRGRANRPACAPPHGDWPRRCCPPVPARATCWLISPRRSRSSRRWPQGLRLPPGADPAHHRSASSPGASGSARDSSPAALEADRHRKPGTSTPLEVVHTDGAFGQASPDFARTDRSGAAGAAAASQPRSHPGRARVHRRHPGRRGRPPWAGAAPTLRPRCWPAPSGPVESRSGRMCPAC